MLTSLQFILLIFVLFFLSRAVLRAREGTISKKTALFWVALWLVAIVGVVQPTVTSKIAQYFGVGRGVDVIIYIAISVLSYLVFRLYVMIEDIRREITSVVRSVALKNVKQTSKSSKSASKGK